MGKRTSGKFRRRKQDAYDTPADAVAPVIPHIQPEARYLEPCAGAYDLVNALPFECVAATDLVPRDERVFRMDAMSVTRADVDATGADYIITNPPWTRELLHPMIELFASIRPTWLLFDADWIHTIQARPFLLMCNKVVSVGRVSWMQNGTSGLDNCAWHLFDANHIGPTRFFGR